MVPASDPVAIKLYANRRLYQPCSGSYVTLDELKSAAHRGARIVVRDARSGADLTDFILGQTPTEH
jgi:polyhydroxyalkanoate synthesis regulator protein